jgi:hypothetical protein
MALEKAAKSPLFPLNSRLLSQKLKFWESLCIMLFVLGACGVLPAKKQEKIPAVQPAREQAALWTITDFRGKDTGGAVPAWALLYLEGGNTAVETLPEFQDRYVFVSMNEGLNFNALEQWLEGFSPEQDFARLAAVRMEKRLLSAVAGFPDDEYGSYFETLIRAASDADWEGPRREEDIWVKRRFFSLTEDETRESWVFLILTAIKKDVLVPQINTLLKNTKPSQPLNRGQTNTVGRVVETFFEGF